MFKQLEPAALQHQLQRLQKVFRVKGHSAPNRLPLFQMFPHWSNILISIDILQHVPKIVYRNHVSCVSLVSEAHVESRICFQLSLWYSESSMSLYTILKWQGGLKKPWTLAICLNRNERWQVPVVGDSEKTALVSYSTCFFQISCCLAYRFCKSQLFIFKIQIG